MKANTDIDIDLVDRDTALANIKHVPAFINGVRHNTSVYFQNIPEDPMTGLAALDAKEAADLGYFKIDLLNNSIYKKVRDEAHLVELANRQPPWELFADRNVVQNLSQIYNYFEIVDFIQPKCIEDLAIIIALIRPGKKHLIGKSRTEIDAEIWKPTSDNYWFKKSHSFAYAVSIVVQLNLMVEEFE